MPNCTNCGTWNPDDKDICWRCQTELPRPVEQRKRDPRKIAGMPLWFWVAMVAFFAVTFLGQCFVPPPG